VFGQLRAKGSDDDPLRSIGFEQLATLVARENNELRVPFVIVDSTLSHAALKARYLSHMLRRE
jgi:hypothetical protein